MFTRLLLILLITVPTMANGKISYMPYPSRSLALSAVYSLLLAESDNLIGVNPGAETGDMTGWAGSTGVTVLSADPYSGTYHFDLPGSKMLYTGASNQFDLIKNQRYKIIFAAEAVGEGSENGPVVSIQDENGLFAYSGQMGAITTSYQIYSINFTSSRDYSNCVLKIVNSLGVHLYVDYFYVVPEYCDYGTEDFSLDFVIQPFTQAGYRVVAHKMSADATRGWMLYYSGTTYKYSLKIGDGTTVIDSLFNNVISQIQNQEYHHVRVDVDRSGNASLSVNDVAKGTIDISTVTGNISVETPLRLFGWDDTTDLMSGYCDYIRLARGTLLTTAERALEYARIAAGRMRTATSQDLMWDFNDNLLDSTGALRLASSPATTEAYADGWPYCVGPLTYAFTKNFSYGHRENYLSMDAVLRDKQTGAAFLYPGPRKRQFVLPFTALKQAQMSAFWAAWEGGQPLDFWPDSAKREYYTCAMPTPPEYTSTPYFSGGEVVYDTELELVET